MLNWRFMQAPQELVDYLALNEVVDHLRHPPHRPAYWNAVAQYMPHCQAASQKLRTLERTMFW